MIGAGTAALTSGLFLVQARFVAASGADRVLVLGPVFEADALTFFAAQHFLAARVWVEIRDVDFGCCNTKPLSYSTSGSALRGC